MDANSEKLLQVLDNAIKPLGGKNLRFPNVGKLNAEIWRIEALLGREQSAPVFHLKQGHSRLADLEALLAAKAQAAAPTATPQAAALPTAPKPAPRASAVVRDNVEQLRAVARILGSVNCTGTDLATVSEAAYKMHVTFPGQLPSTSRRSATPTRFAAAERALVQDAINTLFAPKTNNR